MRIVLDTHILLWLMEEDRRLSAQARAMIADADAVYVSSVSLWEIAVKWKLGKIKEEPRIVEAQLASAGLEELAITHAHAVATAALPLLHKDPFDRMLVAQAITEPLALLTSDRKLAPYSNLVVMA